METRLTLTAQFISDGRALGYDGERLERYVAEQKVEYERAKKEEFERETARLEREERLKKEAKAEEERLRKEAQAEEKARLEREERLRREAKAEEERLRREAKADEAARHEREERARREEHERWKERDAREELKRKDELELARLKEKSAPEAGAVVGQAVEVRQTSVLDRLDKNFQGMKEEDDLLAYLTHFEAVAARCKIESKEWALLLSYKLTTPLKNFMLRDSLFLSDKYEDVKTALLRHADINAETCRKRFHRVKPRQNDFRGYVTERRTALDNWCKMAEVGKTVDEIKDLLIKDGILENVSGEVYRQLVLNKQNTVENMLDIIEGFKVANSGASLAKEESVYVAAACGEAVNRGPAVERKVIVCFGCGMKGHKSVECPQRSPVANSTPVADGRSKKAPATPANSHPNRNVSLGRYRRQFDGSGRRIRGTSTRRQSYDVEGRPPDNGYGRSGGTGAYAPRPNYNNRTFGPPIRYR
ncbi:myosin-4-like isoform X1 [Biomphalaria glabrata]|uniref:Myosin-4-like isoform X1 n=1 Tax=Biomphalaria glabrata TaxID=6526 RepID=A0A9W2YJJ8_BIOGL|nr:myosin-4-like isoform X1 [Biomphalaria glabrata]